MNKTGFVSYIGEVDTSLVDGEVVIVGLARNAKEVQEMRDKVKVGDTVMLKGYIPRRGCIRYIGPAGDQDEMIGIELAEYLGSGEEDGSYHGIKYFECPDGHGIFVKRSDIGSKFDEKDLM